MQQDATHPEESLDIAIGTEALSSQERESLLRASKQASARRIERIRELLVENELDALYIRDLSNIKWVTAFQGVFDDEAAHALVITPHDAIIHSDLRYGEALEAAAQDSQIQVSFERTSHANWLSHVLAGISVGGQRTAIEDTLTLREFHALEQVLSDASVGSELAERARLVEGLRERKDALEVALMRKAQAITDAGFAFIVDLIEPGMTEAEVQRALDSFMLDAGAEGLAFSTIVAAGAHAASPHAISGDTRIARGDAIVMDFGARFCGYCSDMTRTVFVGEPTEKMYRAWEAMRSANEAAEAALRSGKTGAEIHELAETVLAEGGFANTMGHGLGHSLGIDIHEDPALSPRNTKPLPAGAVLTVEPGIYLPAEFGMRLEDFGVVTETGYDVITQSGHDMVIIEPH